MVHDSGNPDVTGGIEPHGAERADELLPRRELITSVSRVAHSMTESNVDEVIEAQLSRMARALDLSAVSLWRLDCDVFTLEYAMSGSGEIEIEPTRVAVTPESYALMTTESFVVRSARELTGDQLFAGGRLVSSETTNLIVPLDRADFTSVLVFGDVRPREWTEGEIEIAMAVADILRHAQARVAAEALTANRLGLSKLTEHMSTVGLRATEETIDDVLVELLTLSVDYFKLSGASIFRLEPDCLRLRKAVFADGLQDERSITLPIKAEGIDMELLWERGLGFVDNALLASHLDTLAHDPRSKVMCVPYGTAGIMDGLVAFTDASRRRWIDHDIEAAQALAKILAQLRSRLTAERALRHRVELEDLVSEIASEFVQVRLGGFDIALEDALDRLLQFFNADAVALWQRDDSECRLLRTCCVTSARGASIAVGHSLPLDNSLVKQSFEATTAHQLTMGDVHEDNIPDDQADATLLVVPTHAPSQAKALTVVDIEPREWEAADKTALTSVARLIAQLSQRLEAERLADYRRRIDHAVAAIASDLVDRTTADSHEGIESSLASFRLAIGAEAVAIWASNPFTGNLVVRNRVTARRADLDEHRLQSVEPNSPAFDYISQLPGVIAFSEDELAEFGSPVAGVERVVVADLGSAHRAALVVNFSENPVDLATANMRVDSFTKLIGQFIKRVELEARAEGRVEIERTLSEIAARFVEVDQADAYRDAAQAIARFAATLDVDEATSWRIVDGNLKACRDVPPKRGVVG